MPSNSGGGVVAAPSRHVLAHSARAAGQTLRSLTAALAGRGASVQDIDIGVFCVAQAADVAALFSALEAALGAPFGATRATALRTAVLALRGLPPHLSAPHLLPLTRRLVALHRASIPAPDSRFLLALAACAAAAAPLRSFGKDAEAISGALVDTTLAHVAAILAATAPVRHDAPALGPLLCVALACVTAAPSLVRPRVPVLMALVDEAGFQSSVPSVRSTAVTLAARLLAARSMKARPHEAVALVTRACDGITQIVAVLSRYTARPGSSGEVDPVLHGLDAHSLLARFWALCDLLTAVFAQPFTHSVDVPVSRTVSAIVGAIRISAVDPMATSALQPMLTPEDVLGILPGIHEAALAALPAFLRAIQMGAALPCLASAAGVISDSLLNHAPRSGDVEPELPSLRIRTELYTAVANITAVFGPPAVDLLARSFAAVFAADAALYTRLRAARRRACLPPTRADDSGSGAFSGGGNSRKRRRMQGGRGAAGAASQALVAALNGQIGAPGEDAMRLVDSAVNSGARAAAAVFRALGVPEPSVCSAIHSIEKSVAAIVALRETRNGALPALAAAIQGAGSNGVNACATPLLESALIAVPQMGCTGFDPGASPDAVANAKAALEALLHPHGPPVVKSKASAATASAPSNAETFAYMPPVQNSGSASGPEHLQGNGVGQVAELASGMQKATQMLSNGGLFQEKIQPSGVVYLNDSQWEDAQAKKAAAVEKEKNAKENSVPVHSEMKAIENAPNEIVLPSDTEAQGNEDVVMVPEDEGRGDDAKEKSIAKSSVGPVRTEEHNDGDADGTSAEVGRQESGDDNLDDDEDEVLQSLRFEASDEE